MADKRLRLIVEAVTSQAQQKLRSFGGAVRQFGDQAGRQFDAVTHKTRGFGESLTNLQTVAKVALAMMASHYARAAAESIVSLAEMAATNLALEDSFEAVARRSNLASTAILEAIDRASRGTIDRFSAMGMASTAMRLKVATNTEEFEKLMKITYMRARETGMGVAEAWRWMTIGIGRNSPRVLDNLNILIKTSDVLDRHAQLLGRTADELSLLEQQEALRNEVLRQGADDLEHWNEIGDQSIDVFERYTKVTKELRQELGERLLPTVTSVFEKLTTLPTILDQLGYITGVTFAGMTASWREFADLVEERDWAAIFAGQTIEAGESAMRGYALIDHAHKQILPNLEELAAKLGRIRDVVLGAGDAQEELAQDTEEAAQAAEKAEGIWSTYLSNVAEQNWRFATRVEDAQFRAAQAAERAAFQLYEIERDAGDRRSDLLENVAIRVEADTARHYNKLRYMKRDLLDELRDMEWDYQQDRSDIMRQAPYWVRNALGAEFRERDRIIASGDRKALKRFDKQLRERIRAIDPAYAEELDRLEERYKHEKQIERREARQARRRQKQDWSISTREQGRSLDLQLRQLERGLAHLLESWDFHGLQREASEKWSMERMLTEHDHQLGRMYDDTQRRLSQLSDLYKHYGYVSGSAWAQGLADAQRDAGGLGLQIPVGESAFLNLAGLQKGTDYVPRTMPAVLHKGEAVLPAPVAQQYREGAGGVTIHIENLNVAGGRAGAKQFVRQIEEELGQGIRRRSR